MAGTVSILKLEKAYIASGVWKCEKSPTGAHHWIGAPYGELWGTFYCKYCSATKEFPVTLEDAEAMVYKKGNGKHSLAVGGRSMVTKRLFIPGI